MDGLVEDVRRHFAEEEGEMLRYEYPKLAEHREHHRTFVRRLEALRAESSGSELVALFAKSLEKWLKNHEQSDDKEVLVFLGLTV